MIDNAARFQAMARVHDAANSARNPLALPTDDSVLGRMLATGPRRHHDIQRGVATEPLSPCAPIKGDIDPTEPALAYRIMAMRGFATFCHSWGYHDPSEYDEFIGLSSPLKLVSIEDTLAFPHFGAGEGRQRSHRDQIIDYVRTLPPMLNGYHYLFDPKEFVPFQARTDRIYKLMRDLLGITVQLSAYELIATVEANALLAMFGHDRVEADPKYRALNAPPEPTLLDKRPSAPPVVTPEDLADPDWNWETHPHGWFRLSEEHERLPIVQSRYRRMTNEEHAALFS